MMNWNHLPIKGTTENLFLYFRRTIVVVTIIVVSSTHPKPLTLNRRPKLYTLNFRR